ncbi:MAG: hypothetical protein AAF226_03660, partial [Verrucomicrobiota bacterium]
MSEPMNELETIQKILGGTQAQTLDSVEKRVQEVTDPAYLPRALSQSHHAQSSELVQSLKAPVVDAIKASVREDRKSLSSALFPILGPAVRLYVRDYFRSMVDSLNETLRTATSLKRLRWIAEAKFAGIPYSEYVMMKTLNYQIDKVFLIDPNSGLLFDHAQRVEDPNEHPELVSGMLVAIRNFVKDSFSKDPEDDSELGRFSFGDQDIFLENGPLAIVASVGEGTPPPAYRASMGECIDSIHAEAAEEIEQYTGDNTAIVEKVHHHLESLLVSNNNAQHAEKRNRWPARIFLALMAVLFFALLTWALVGIIRTRKALNALRTEPGIEVIDHQKRIGRDTINIIRDPLAKQPDQVLAAAGIPANWCNLNESAFISAEEPFATMRLRDQAEANSETAELYQKELFTLNQRIEKLEQGKSDASAFHALAKKQFFQRYPISETADIRNIGEDHWKLIGKAEPHWFEKIQKEKNSLIPGETVDLSATTAAA